jgi:hypothetical protein
MTVGQVLEKSEEELLSLRNFGRKSYDELRDKLNEMNLIPADQPEVMEAPPLDEGETPIAAKPEAAAETPAEAPAAVEEMPEPAAEAEPAAEGEEEIPDWKRKLMEITGEEGEG